MATGKQVIAALTVYEDAMGVAVNQTLAARILAMHAALDAAASAELEVCPSCFAVIKHMTLEVG